MPKEVHLYTCKSVTLPLNPDFKGFAIGKLTEGLEVLATYNLTESKTGTLHCDCPAYKPWCRHCKILRIFQAEDKVDKGWFYNFDKKEWIPPMEVQS